MSEPWAQHDEPAPLGPVTTLVEGSSFALSDLAGDMGPGQAQGLFVRDTRVLSVWQLRLDGEPLEPLSSRVAEPFAAVFVGRARNRSAGSGSVIVERHRFVGDGLREDITVENFGREPTALHLSVVVDGDFADVFDVKAGRSVQAGHRRHQVKGDEMRIEYRHGGLSRAVRVVAPGATVTPGQLSYRIVLPAKQRWQTSLQVVVVADEEELPARFPGGEPIEQSRPARELADWHANVPRISTNWASLSQALARSEQDLAVLRITDPSFEGSPVVAAGAPWFMTLFGRDSILASWMMLPFGQELAVGTLKALAQLQGRRFDPSSEEEPGRVPHELRRGMVTALSPGLSNLYFGSVDATPLFVMLLGELSRWGHKVIAGDELLAAADRALKWAVDTGDRDGDGFIEYERATDHGLRNQGWKDSFDGINFSSGRLADAPIALAEVQGYAYAAFVARAELASLGEDLATAEAWSQRAQALKRSFNDRFWLPDKQLFAIALDGDKTPVDALASNMGHCLWTGIIDDDKAGAVAGHLLGEELFSGFGVRTLATSMGAYDPASYHNGSVWPHDTAIAAAGLARYGFYDEARQLCTALLDAADAFGGRLPELFCGFSRHQHPLPVPYPTSCSPQAWASASPALLLRTLLGLAPCIPEGRVLAHPILPEGVELVARDVPLGEARFSLFASGDKAHAEGLPEGISLQQPRKQEEPPRYG